MQSEVLIQIWRQGTSCRNCLRQGLCHSSWQKAKHRSQVQDQSLTGIGMTDHKFPEGLNSGSRAFHCRGQNLSFSFLGNECAHAGPRALVTGLRRPPREGFHSLAPGFSFLLHTFRLPSCPISFTLSISSIKKEQKGIRNVNNWTLRRMFAL